MEIIYVRHPVTPEKKAELRAKGYKILDAKFAPEGYEFGDSVYAETNDDQESLIAQLKERGINRDKRTSVEKLRELLAEVEQKELQDHERQEISKELTGFGVEHDATRPLDELRALLVTAKNEAGGE